MLHILTCTGEEIDFPVPSIVNHYIALLNCWLQARRGALQYKHSLSPFSYPTDNPPPEFGEEKKRSTVHSSAGFELSPTVVANVNGKNIARYYYKHSDVGVKQKGEAEEADKVEVAPGGTVASLRRFRAALIGPTQGLPKRRRLCR